MLQGTVSANDHGTPMAIDEELAACFNEEETRREATQHQQQIDSVQVDRTGCSMLHTLRRGRTDFAE